MLNADKKSAFILVIPIYVCTFASCSAKHYGKDNKKADNIKCRLKPLLIANLVIRFQLSKFWKRNFPVH